MGAKKLVARESETERSLVSDSLKPASAAVIMESMVATEAELRALWAQSDEFVAAGSRASTKRIGVV
jgi:hypothetical protein